MFDRLGRLVLRFRFVLVAGWVVGAVFFGVFGPSLTQVGFADERSFLPRDSESLAAREVIAESFPSDSAPSQALIVFSRAEGLTDADRAAIEGLRPYFESADHPDGALRYVTAERSPTLASMLRSSDGVVELARVYMNTPSFLPRTNATINEVRAHLESSGVLPGGLAAQVTGQAGIGRDYLQAIQDGTDRTTLVTIVLVVLVLLLIYRAPLAALVPLLTIGAAFLVSRGTLGFLARGGWQLSSVLDSFIVVLVFGVGRLPEVGGAVGKGIREFRKATKDDEDEDAAKAAAMQSSAAPADAAVPAAPAAPSADTMFCSECGTKNLRTVKFCTNCGHSIGSAVS